MPGWRVLKRLWTQKYWLGNTIENIASVFDMYPLTLDGLGEATTHLMKSK